MVPKRQRAKDGSEEKKNGAYKKIEAKPPSDSVSGEREAKYGKEGEEVRARKKRWLLVGNLRNRGMQIWRRTRQSRGRGPRCSAHKDVPSSPVTI